MISSGPCRPDPEELLRRIQIEESTAARGRLKIFLGYAPRVGKSQRMFDEGLRRLERGQDVVAGAIQMEGSQELESHIRSMEVIPPLMLPDSQGTPVRTLDVPAILARAPHVCLIDELARDNPPGSRHPHRWEDVEELRDAGINVVGAVNLQHILEEQEAVERVTGKRSSVSIPAGFVHSADELVLVDVPPEGAEASGAGVSRRYTPAQLNELRELALLFAASVVEEQLQRYMKDHGINQSWGTQERILVCITPRSSAAAMLNSASRATERFHGQMLVIYVRQENLSREEEEMVSANLELARRLGAEVHIFEDRDAIGRILKFAREERITQLFIGHSQRKAWKFWAPNLVDRLIESAEGMDVRLFPQARPD